MQTTAVKVTHCSVIEREPAMHLSEQPLTPNRLTPALHDSTSCLTPLNNIDRHEQLSTVVLQPCSTLDSPTDTGSPQKLGLRALTDTLTDYYTRSDYSLADAADITRSSSCSSSSSTIGIDPALPWVPTTPPGTPAKLLHTSSMNSSSSSSSSGPSSPRSIDAVAVVQDTADQHNLVSTPAGDAPVASVVLEGLSEDARKTFQGKRVLITVSRQGQQAGCALLNDLWGIERAGAYAACVVL